MGNTKRKERYKSERKARVFERNEGQLKDGRYYYKYPKGMKDGQVQYGRIYSWTLTPTDRWPADKRPGKHGTKCLRELEQEINAIPFSKNTPTSLYSNMTVLEMVERYVEIKKSTVKNTTATHYDTTINWLKKDVEFGQRNLTQIMMSEAKQWMINLNVNKGKKYSTLNHFHTHLKDAYQMVISDGGPVQGNPFAFQMKEVISEYGETRESISFEQMEQFLHRVQTDNYFNRYYDAIYVLFTTGLRISEFCGLQVSDIDFENKCLYVRRQLMRNKKSVFYIETLKTKSGQRVIPLSDQTCGSLKNMIAKRRKAHIPEEIKEYSEFLYYDKDGRPGLAMTWEHYFQHIREKFDKKFPDDSPYVCPHICRHTFCSNLMNAGVSLSVVKYVMGHSDFDVTLNIYTHAHNTDAEKELRDLYSQNPT